MLILRNKVYQLNQMKTFWFYGIWSYVSWNKRLIGTFLIVLSLWWGPKADPLGTMYHHISKRGASLSMQDMPRYSKLGSMTSYPSTHSRTRHVAKCYCTRAIFKGSFPRGSLEGRVALVQRLGVGVKKKSAEGRITNVNNECCSRRSWWWGMR